MSAAAIKAFGIFTFLVEAFVLLVFVAFGELDRGLPVRFMISVMVFFFATTVIGIGLLLLRKWAAILFSLALAALPIWLTLNSSGEARFAWYAMSFVLAVVSIAPIVIVIRSWSLLSWNGKWFF
jgi:hypothetical protein